MNMRNLLLFVMMWAVSTISFAETFILTGSVSQSSNFSNLASGTPVDIEVTYAVDTPVLPAGNLYHAEFGSEGYVVTITINGDSVTTSTTNVMYPPYVNVSLQGSFSPFMQSEDVRNVMLWDSNGFYAGSIYSLVYSYWDATGSIQPTYELMDITREGIMASLMIDTQNINWGIGSFSVDVSSIAIKGGTCN